MARLIEGLTAFTDGHGLVLDAASGRVLGGLSDCDTHYRTGEPMLEVETEEGYRFWALEVDGPAR
jgi:hypothetical protein